MLHVAIAHQSLRILPLQELTMKYVMMLSFAYIIHHTSNYIINLFIYYIDNYNLIIYLHFKFLFNLNLLFKNFI